MVDAQPEKPAPAAQGTLGKSPFPHLLVYAYERQLLGTMEFEGPAGEMATILFIDGCPAKVRTSEPVAYLGSVLLEMDVVTESAVRFSLRRVAEEKRLHGQILLEAGAITQEDLVSGLRTQLARKLQHLSHLPPETTFAYYDAFDALSDYGGDDDASLDPFPLVWAAIREEPSWEHVSAALTKVGTFGLRIGSDKETDRFGFDTAEQRVIDMLRERSWRMHELNASGVLSPTLMQLLVYCLLITKHVGVVRESMMPAADAPVMEAEPIEEVEPEPEDPVPEPPSSKNPLSSNPSSSSHQAVGRLKLQPKVVVGRPVAVEERAAGLPWDRRQTPPGGIAAADPLPLAPPSPASSLVDTPRPSPPVPLPLGKPAPMATQALPPLPFDDAGPPPSPLAPALPYAASPSPLGDNARSARPPASPPAAMSSPAPAPVAPVAPTATAPPAPLSPEHAARKAEIHERAAAIGKQNFFEMLGISKESTPEQATAAYFNLAKRWHPDRLAPPLRDCRDECAKVFTHLSEAHQTLTDKEKRARYMTLLKDGGATPEAQEEIVKVIEAATNFQKAEICMRRNDLAQAEDLCKKAIAADPQQPDYIAMSAWIDAQKPANQSAGAAEELIKRLARAIALNANCERAYFYRGMLLKRVQRDAEAIKDFRRAYDLNPRNVDAQREVRLAEMRGTAGTTAAKKKKAEEEKGGLFGKLFKK